MIFLSSNRPNYINYCFVSVSHSFFKIALRLFDIFIKISTLQCTESQHLSKIYKGIVN